MRTIEKKKPEHSNACCKASCQPVAHTALITTPFPASLHKTMARHRHCSPDTSTLHGYTVPCAALCNLHPTLDSILKSTLHSTLQNTLHNLLGCTPNKKFHTPHTQKNKYTMGDVALHMFAQHRAHKLAQSLAQKPLSNLPLAGWKEFGKSFCRAPCTLPSVFYYSTAPPAKHTYLYQI